MTIKKTSRTNSLLPDVFEFFHHLEKVDIADARKELIRPLKDFIKSKKDLGRELKLNFVCTHNSRRSQLAQIWATIFLKMAGFEGEVISSGTEKTAVHINILETLLEIGFRVIPKDTKDSKNIVFHSFNEDPISLYSKTIDELNVDTFASVFVCSNAKETCPVIIGDVSSFYLPFEDPGAHDDEQDPIAEYLKTAQNIAAELYYAFGFMK